MARRVGIIICCSFIVRMIWHWLVVGVFRLETAEDPVLSSGAHDCLAIVNCPIKT